MEKFGGNYSMNTPPALYKNLAIIAGAHRRAGPLRDSRRPARVRPADRQGSLALPRRAARRVKRTTAPGASTAGRIARARRVGADVGRPGERPRLRATRQRHRSELRQQPARARTSTRRRSWCCGRRPASATWHFQMTHHDIYDWDVSSQPSLFEATINGQRVPAVAQMTKQGLLFMFNRLTGEPLFGVEERPVPRFDAPGDRGVADAAVSRQTRGPHARQHDAQGSQQDLAGGGEVLHGAVRQVGQHGPVHAVRHAAEPGVSRVGGRRRLGRRRHQPDARPRVRATRGISASSRSCSRACRRACCRRSRSQKIPTTFYTDPQGYPCNAPPWSELVAVSTTTGDIVWRTPLGEYPELTAKGILNTGTARQRRRTDRHRQRARLHRRDRRLRLPRVRRQDAARNCGRPRSTTMC